MEISHKINYINDIAYVTVYVTYPDEYEFALDFDTFRKNVSEVSTEIKKYIREHFEKTKGFTFVLVLNGLLVGTILSTEATNFEKSISEDSIGQEISTIDTSFKGTSDSSEKNVNPQSAEITTDNSNNGISEEKSQENVPVVPPATDPQNTTTNQPAKSTEQKAVVQQTPKPAAPVKQPQPTPAPTPAPTPTPPQQTGYTLNLKLASGQVINISLEDYVIGVVSSEMPASFSTEALKAQSVAARTYALKKTASGATISATISDQVYKTNSQLQSQWGSSYNTYYTKIKNAVYATKGVYMTYGGNYIDATYFSTSNGKTEDAVFVWGNSVPYLKSVSSPWDVGIASYSSSATFTYAQLSSKIGVTLTSNSDIKIINKTTGDRVKTAIFGTKELTGVKVRSLLGLRSADFDMTKTSTGVTFSCRGYGHGVGMSQYGANGMANSGSTYRQILQHYYTGISFGTK